MNDYAVYAMTWHAKLIPLFEQEAKTAARLVLHIVVVNKLKVFGSDMYKLTHV